MKEPFMRERFPFSLPEAIFLHETYPRHSQGYKRSERGHGCERLGSNARPQYLNSLISTREWTLLLTSGKLDPGGLDDAFCPTVSDLATTFGLAASSSDEIDNYSRTH